MRLCPSLSKTNEHICRVSCSVFDDEESLCIVVDVEYLCVLKRTQQIHPPSNK